MKKTAIIFFCLLSCIVAGAQVVFKTIVPQPYVIEGEPFRVQYVAQGADVVGNFTAPPFDGFRVVSGPEVYTGKASGFFGQPRQLKNTVYTLEPIKPGRYPIPGAVAIINGKTYSSNDVWVNVVSRQDADRNRKQEETTDNSAYLLKPGEDPYEKIRQNLFVKVMVNKKKCFPGEPVVATIKLYSRLQSKSDIVKNPGLYGFTVYDMIGLSDKVVAVESVNGRLFDVHTIRKVQLYPLQPGSFSIDPMEIKNRVEFSRSGVSRKTEQEIIEGVFDEKEPAPPAGVEVFESNISTEAIPITVKPLPDSNRPDDFNGATGRFTMTASLEKNELAKNEEGYLVVTLKGKGNFTQLTPPVVEWPAGIEGFDPTITESIDKTTVPLAGVKTYRYAFVSSKPGTYELPAASFSFFDPDTNTYKTLRTDSKRVAVSTKEKLNPVITAERKDVRRFSNKSSWIAAGVVVVLGLTVLIYWSTRKKDTAPVKTTLTEKEPAISIDQLLQPCRLLIPAADRDFYTLLHRTIWNYMADRFSLSGSEQSKHGIYRRVSELNNGPAMANELLNILGKCEAGMFTNAEMGENKEELLGRVKVIFETINQVEK